MHRGVTDQIRIHGYAAQEFRLGAERPSRLLEILRARGITGLVFAPVAEKTQRYDFPWDEFSAVQLGTGPAGLELPRVAHHHFHGALEAVRRCAEHGYRRPGLVLDRAHDERLGHVWRAGFEMGAEACGFARNVVWLMSEQRPDLPSLRAWLKLKKPDVIVTNLHEMFERLLGEVGLTVPHDVGLVSLSVPALGHRVTGIEQNSTLIGARAIDLLAGALQLHRTGLLPEAISTLVNGRWNPGETL
jgi:DNA-binding LacI/PurR family transcriptional regulator